MDAFTVQSSNFVYHLNNYSLNWTPLSPITIIYMYNVHVSVWIAPHVQQA